MLNSITQQVWFRCLSFVMVCTAVLYALFRPTPPAMVFEHSDKAGHIVAFMALTVTSRMVFFRYSRFASLFVMLFLAFALEYLQGELRPLRLFSCFDVVANMAGVMVGFVAEQVYIIKNRGKSVFNK